MASRFGILTRENSLLSGNVPRKIHIPRIPCTGAHASRTGFGIGKTGCCAASLGAHTVCLSVFFFPRQFSLFRQRDLADQNHTSYAYLSAKSYGKELYPRNVQSLKIRTAVRAQDVQKRLEHMEQLPQTSGY